MKSLTQSDIQNFVVEFYTDSTEDIVGLFAIAKEVGELLGDDESTREQALRVVNALLDKGMLAGNPPYYPGGYEPWTDQGRNAVISRIRTEWIALGRMPDIPDIVWFGPPA